MRHAASRHTSKPASFSNLLAAVALISVAGCATPPEAPKSDAKPAAAAPATQKVDPTGRWCFQDRRGRALTDSIELVNGGIIIGPVGRKGREIFYTDGGLNLYRHGSGASYRFLGNGQATWERRKERRSLRRCG